MTQFRDGESWSRELKRMLETQEPENLHLDYKDKRRLLLENNKRADEVSKDASSFLNSDGGAIIYGVPEAKGSSSTGGAPIPLNKSVSGDFGFDPGEIDKETIENVITSSIQPRPGPEQFQITEVKHGDRVVFVVEVAVGIGEVWQARDKRYYKRFHYKAEPMEHYEIGLVRNRHIGPDLKLVFGLDERWRKEIQSWEGGQDNPSIHLGVQNISNSVAESALIELGTVNEIELPSPFKCAGDRLVNYESRGLRGVRMKWHQVSWTASNSHIAGKYGPIFKTASPLHVADFSPTSSGTFLGPFVWRIQAPHMMPRTGLTHVGRDPYGLRIREEDLEAEIT